MDEGCADAFLCRECFFETDKVNNVVPKIAENNKQYLQSLSMHALNANEANPIIPAISVPSVQRPSIRPSVKMPAFAKITYDLVLVEYDACLGYFALFPV